MAGLYYREGPKEAQARLARAKAREDEAKKSWNERTAAMMQRQKHNPWTGFDYSSIDYAAGRDAADDGPEMLPRPSGARRRHELDLMSAQYYRNLACAPPRPPPPRSSSSAAYAEEREQRIADIIEDELRIKAAEFQNSEMLFSS